MDTLGNEEKSPSLYAVTYDTTPPQITLLDLVLGVLKNVTASDSSGVEKIEVSKDKITWEDYTSEMDLNDLVGNQPGTYTIYVRVTDKAGNQTVSPVTFTIPQPATTPGGQTLGARTQRTVLATTSTLTEETTETTTEEEITEEEVLGETTCEATYKISGTVYYDNNDNGIKDDNEKVVEGIKVNIYNSNKELEKTVTTDEKGYWEASLCPGEYTTQVEGTEDQTFVLGDSDTTLDISVEKKTNWWLIAVIGSAVVILLVVLADRYNKRKVS
ncbi:MAG TPA: SdrD B-like domain-containing protein [Candidatus Dojkabacteria bacterium]|nr:SdrD B-like domain-containing protein [Candidatus Dojkabacteria bacterium]